MTEVLEIDKTLLLEIRAGIIEAIYSEDGLDGADGTYLLSGINEILGFEVDHHGQIYEINGDNND